MFPFIWYFCPVMLVFVSFTYGAKYTRLQKIKRLRCLVEWILYRRRKTPLKRYISTTHAGKLASRRTYKHYTFQVNQLVNCSYPWNLILKLKLQHGNTGYVLSALTTRRWKDALICLSFRLSFSNSSRSAQRMFMTSDWKEPTVSSDCNDENITSKATCVLRSFRAYIGEYWHGSKTLPTKFCREKWNTGLSAKTSFS